MVVFGQVSSLPALGTTRRVKYFSVDTQMGMRIIGYDYWKIFLRQYQKTRIRVAKMRPNQVFNTVCLD